MTKPTLENPPKSDIVIKQVVLSAGDPPRIRMQVANRKEPKSKYWLSSNFFDSSLKLFSKSNPEEFKKTAPNQLMISQLLNKNIIHLNPCATFESHDPCSRQWIFSFGEAAASYIWIRRGVSADKSNLRNRQTVEISCIRKGSEVGTFESYLRLNEKGIFTKIKVLEKEEVACIPSLKDSNFNQFSKIDFMDSVSTQVDSEHAHLIKKNIDSTPANPPGVGALKSTLKRRLRTLAKTRKSLESRLAACADIEPLERLAMKLQYDEWRRQLQTHISDFPMDEVTRDFVASLLESESFGPAKDELFTHIQGLRKRLLLETPRLQQILQNEEDIRLLLETPDQLLKISKDANSNRSIFVKLGINRSSQGLQRTIHPQLANSKVIKETNRKNTLDAKRQIGRRFVINSTDFFIVGRTASENDQLTKSAKGNQWWFHVFGYSGSHVILSASSQTLKNKQLDPKLLRAGAILAIHFSGRRQSMSADVTIARKSDLKKVPKSAPGLWSVLKATTSKIQYSSDELESIYKSNQVVGDQS
jgi:predicted ribosome quality control (RQC) complex YloA/Tae2 family protein